MDPAEIDKRFDYHQPDEFRKQRHEVVREAVKEAALQINTLLPEGREKSLAFTHLEEALFWSNAAIAREGA